MRVLLVHNQKPGYGASSKEELLAILNAHGHEPRYISADDPALPGALADPGEAVLIAGGDGTVAVIAKLMAGLPTPLVVLPAGTANNVAKTFAIEGNLSSLITAMPRGHHALTDLGEITIGEKKKFFLESIGIGVFADMMNQLTEERQGEDKFHTREDDIQQARVRVAEAFRCGEPQNTKLILDGVEYSGRYYLVEIMNLRSMGPNLVLAPGAPLGDGLIDVVTVGEAERERFIEFLLAGNSVEATAQCTRRIRCRSALLQPGGRWMHIDDEAVELEEGASLQIRSSDKQLCFLIPGDPSAHEHP